MGFRQFVVVVFCGFKFRVIDICLLCIEESDDEITTEEQRDVYDKGYHILRLPKVNLFCKLHILLFFGVFDFS